MFGQVQDTVKVGSVLIDVETGDSSAPTSSPPKPQPTPAAAPSAPSAPSATPAPAKVPQPMCYIGVESKN